MRTTFTVLFWMISANPFQVDRDVAQCVAWMLKGDELKPIQSLVKTIIDFLCIL